jgi:pimeloyl-ACP methyl ester carboxylesterase
VVAKAPIVRASVGARVLRDPNTDPGARAQFLLDQLFSPAFQAAHPEINEWHRHSLSEPAPAPIQRLHRLANEGHEAWDELPAVQASVLVIHGQQDPLVPVENARLLADRIRGARLHLVPSARHGYFVEGHPASTMAVLDFLADHPLDE